jgi:hypothetical protein
MRTIGPAALVHSRTRFCPLPSKTPPAAGVPGRVGRPAGRSIVAGPAAERVTELAERRPGRRLESHRARFGNDAGEKVSSLIYAEL